MGVRLRSGALQRNIPWRIFKFQVCPNELRRRLSRPPALSFTPKVG
jgi:hypothetical protein